MVIKFVDVGLQLRLECFEQDDLAFLGDFFYVGFGVGLAVSDQKGYFGLVVSF